MSSEPTKPERQPLEPVWPGDVLEAEMLASAQTGWDAGCHIRSLLCRVRELERALRATGYFRNSGVLPPAALDDGSCSYFDRWVDLANYTEGVDALLDGVVPVNKDGKPLWLRERVEMLVAKATERNDLVLELYQWLDKEYGLAAQDGYLHHMAETWRKARAVLGVAKDEGR